MNAAAAQTARISPNQNHRRDELICEHLDLVTVVARQVQKTISVHTELDDLVHAGTMGLFDAATRYQDDKEIPFPAYAKHRIRGAILDSLRQIDWASREARKAYKQMDAVTRELSTKLDRTPAPEEIAEAMGLNVRRWQNLMIDFRTLGNMAARQSSADSDEMPAREIPAAPGNCPAHLFARSEMQQRLGVAMQQLPERYRRVVELYYEGDKSMKEIGSLLGVNESRVSQIHKSALEKMQGFFGNAGISSTAAFC